MDCHLHRKWWIGILRSPVVQHGNSRLRNSANQRIGCDHRRCCSAADSSRIRSDHDLLWRSWRRINTSSISSSDLRAALEAAYGLERVHVTGLGTLASPWIITLIDGELSSNGAFQTIRSETFRQSGVIQTQKGTTPAGTQYSYSRSFSNSALATQSLILQEWQTYITVRYGNDSVDLQAGMTAAEVETALESMNSVDDVW